MLIWKEVYLSQFWSWEIIQIVYVNLGGKNKRRIFCFSLCLCRVGPQVGQREVSGTSVLLSCVDADWRWPDLGQITAANRIGSRRRLEDL